jgi:integrase
MATSLDNLTVKNLNKSGRYTDKLVKGLHLWVKSPNHKYWIFRFTYENKQRDLSLGSYPIISLAEARKKAFEMRSKLAFGENPLTEKQRTAAKLNKYRFKDYALEYIETVKHQWRNEKHASQWVNTLEQYAFDYLGTKYIDEIETEDLVKVLQPIWSTKTHTASRLRGRIELILASATARKLRTGINPALWKGHLSTIFPAPNKVAPTKNHEALPYQNLPEFMSQIRELEGVSALALQFLILNGSRTSEVIYGLRKEIQDNIWIIPKERMKAFKEHRVPLCEKSIQLLERARYLDPESNYLFSRNGKPLSNMALASILKRMNLKVTVHGFRSSFRDWIAEETNFSGEVAEMCLAHSIYNKVEKSYRRGDLLDKRRQVLLSWERYCLSRNNVIQFQRA